MPNINSLFSQESGRIGPDLHTRTLGQTPWIDLVRKGAFPLGMGDTITVTTLERSLPGTTPSWTAVTKNANAGNNCVPTAAVISPAHTDRTYALSQAALESLPVCVNDLRTAWQVKDQLDAIYNMLTQNTKWLWQERHRDEYTRLAAHKMIAKAGLPEDPSAFPLQLPESRMTSGIMKDIYQRLKRDGAAVDGGSVDIVNGAPQFIAIMSAEMDEAVVVEDLKIREDLRYADAPVLLKPLGVNRPYRGFYHIIDDFPARWNYADDAFVRVPPYVASAATVGNKYDLNPDYATALYEDVVFYLPTVFTSLVAPSLTAPGGNTKFDPQKYMGDWSWKNIIDRVENPDGTWGYFRGLFMAASKPGYPQFGYVVRCLRPNAQHALVDADGYPVA